MIYTGKATKFSIYINTSPHLTAMQVKAKTGADIVFNGTWYDNSPAKPVGNFKVGGKVLSEEYKECLGYGWNDGNIPKMAWYALKDVDNFICGYPLIYQGKKYSLDGLKKNNPDVLGSRGRTAQGQKADGTWIFVCTSDSNGAMTLEALQDKLLALGCTSAMLYDGGGSSQMITPDGSVLTTRTIYNFACVWLDGNGKATEDTTEATTAHLRGIDVSEHQGVIDWGAAENDIDFAMIRAGYGQNNIDKQFVRNISECNRIGIPCGVYWFSYALNEAAARKEAQYCLEAIKPFRVELPVCFDYEYDSVAYAKRKGYVVSKSLVTALCHVFCDSIEAAKYYAANYTNADYLTRYYDDTTAQYDLWLATWPSTPDLDKPPRECGMWQYSDKGTVAGISGDVDIDVSYRDYPTIIRAAGLNNLAQAPVIAPTEAELAAAWVKAQNISDGTRPSDTATRQEIWQMLYRAFNK